MNNSKYKVTVNDLLLEYQRKYRLKYSRMSKKYLLLDDEYIDIDIDSKVRKRAFEIYHNSLSENSICAYKNCLQKLDEYLINTKKIKTNLFYKSEDWKNITQELVSDYLDLLFEKGYALSTINYNLFVIKIHSKLAFTTKDLNLDEVTYIISIEPHTLSNKTEINKGRSAEVIKNKRSQKNESNYISPEKISLLFDSFEFNKFIDYRDCLIFYVFYALGLKSNELINLNKNYFIKEKKCLFIKRSNDKPGKYLSISSELCAMLSKYLSLCTANDSEALFFSLNGSTKGKRLASRSVKEMFYKYQSILNLTNFSPRDLRHSWIINHIKAGTPLIIIRDLGGWKSLNIPYKYYKEYIEPGHIFDFYSNSHYRQLEKEGKAY